MQLLLEKKNTALGSKKQKLLWRFKYHYYRSAKYRKDPALKNSIDFFMALFVCTTVHRLFDVGGQRSERKKWIFLRRRLR
jgi:hypothetical protein